MLQEIEDGDLIIENEEYQRHYRKKSPELFILFVKLKHSSGSLRDIITCYHVSDQKYSDATRQAWIEAERLYDTLAKRTD